MIQPFVHKRDIGIEPNGGGGESGLIGRPSGTYLRDDAASAFVRKIGIVGAVFDATSTTRYDCTTRTTTGSSAIGQVSVAGNATSRLLVNHRR
jgi:hypothetical protein